MIIIIIIVNIGFVSKDVNEREENVCHDDKPPANVAVAKMDADNNTKTTNQPTNQPSQRHHDHDHD